MDLSVVRNAGMAINSAHRFVYFVPEAGEEYPKLGLEGRGAYFAARAAAMGPVSKEVVLATFYNFSPLAVYSATETLWEKATPDQWQQARFTVAARAIDRVGARLSAAAHAEINDVVDPVLASLDYAGKPLAAANASVPLPADPDVALFQKIAILREWRGDAHIAVLQANQLGPCDCNVMQTGTGRFPLALAQATRMWDEQQWEASCARLRKRGWVDADGKVTAEGTAGREQIEVETDELCVQMWDAVGEAGATKLTTMLAPIVDAFTAAGTYAMLKP